MTEHSSRQWLIVLKPTRATFPADATEQEMALVHRHAAHLQELSDAGKLILAGRTREEADPMGIVILTGVDATEARRIVDEDPAVASGVFRAELRAYQVAIGSGANHEE